MPRVVWWKPENDRMACLISLETLRSAAPGRTVWAADFHCIRANRGLTKIVLKLRINLGVHQGITLDKDRLATFGLSGPSPSAERRVIFSGAFSLNG